MESYSYLVLHLNRQVEQRIKMLAIKVSLTLLFGSFLGIACGGRVGTRIINGMNATEGEFSYYAQLKIIFSKQPQADGGILVRAGYCGGSVIDNQHILTAAHCLKGADHKNVGVTLGIYDIADTKSQQKHSIKSFETHQKFNATTLANDIGIITLAEPITFTPDIQPIKLGCNYTQPEKRVEVAGRGITSDDAMSIPAKVEYANMTTISNDKCAQFYLDIVPSKICAWDRKTKEGTCRGDSGSPLIETVNGTQIQIGVVSGGDPESCEIGSPISFTRVSSYIDWIEKRVQIACVNN